MIERKTYDEICHIMQLGYEYAAALHSGGHFDHMELGQGLVLDHLEAAERSTPMTGTVQQPAFVGDLIAASNGAPMQGEGQVPGGPQFAVQQ